MGNNESNPNPIRNMDKRTARREYKADFAAAITRYRAVHVIDQHNELQNNSRPTPTFTYDDNDNDNDDGDDGVNINVSSGGVLNPTGKNKNCSISVFVRKRPIHKHELSNSEFDVVTATAKNTCVVHDARMHIDMKR